MPEEERRTAEVLAQLDDVVDPELDRSVTAMGFIAKLTVTGEFVDIAFRLPTFWCSANFAFLMAADMKAAVERLPWVAATRVRLIDHFAARKINRGLAMGADFAQIFAGEASGNLADLRRTFREKAYCGRQAALLRELVPQQGVEAAVALTMADVGQLADTGDAKIRALALRYLSARKNDGGPAGPGDPAFTRIDGSAIDARECTAYLREIRRIRGASEANAQMCSMLLEARYAPATRLRAGRPL